MDEVLSGGSGAVFLFLYLFPGFLGSIVYDFLVQGRRRENFERVVAALVLTLLSSVALKVGLDLPLLPLVVDEKTPLTAVIDAFIGRNLFYGSLLSAVFAALLAVLNNKGVIYGGSAQAANHQQREFAGCLVRHIRPVARVLDQDPLQGRQFARWMAKILFAIRCPA